MAVTTETLVRYLASQCGNCCGRSDTEIDFIRAFHFSPVNFIPPLLHIHSFIYHPHRIMFFSQHFSFPCHYHSAIAPYSTSHLNVALTITTNGPSLGSFQNAVVCRKPWERWIRKNFHVFLHPSTVKATRRCGRTCSTSNLYIPSVSILCDIFS